MNYIISAFLSFGIIVVGYFFDDSVLHWFLLPVWGCGILIGADAVAWFRGQLDTFDIKGLIGVFGFHFFFSFTNRFHFGIVTDIVYRIPN